MDCNSSLTPDLDFKSYSLTIKGLKLNSKKNLSLRNSSSHIVSSSDIASISEISERIIGIILDMIINIRT
jgi:hypothetical protein